MAVKIGHAVGDELRKAHGGKAGDQTGKEVLVSNWYDEGWEFVLRCKNKVKAEQMAIACEKGCANNNIGYDQYERNTLAAQAKNVGFDLAKIRKGCETDCSAFMTVCAECAGINVPYSNGNAPTTRTMKSAFYSTGFFDILQDSDYTSSDKKLKRGDILVRPGSHTVMVLEDGKESSMYFKKYTGSSGSIVNALKLIGENSSFSYRTKIAAANKITLYVGTARQNTSMVNLLKQGKLIKP